MDARIIADLAAAHDLTVLAAEPVPGGWMNEKWRIKTAEGGDWLVKVYSRVRFKRQTQLDAIEAALTRQIALHAAGTPCPAIRTCGGRAMRYLDDGTPYMVMGFCPGRMLSAETITPRQMRSLGEVRAHMQCRFDRLPLDGAKGYPLDSEGLLASLWNNLHAREEELTADSPADYAAAVDAQKAILETITPAWLDALPKGLAHEDFAADNMLFDDDGVTAILDFDRSQYWFHWHDLGRALLSFALRGDTLDAGLTAAFLDGYAACRRLTPQDLADALRVTWITEAPWWINPGSWTSGSPKVQRFCAELRWLTQQWFTLDEISQKIIF